MSQFQTYITARNDTLNSCRPWRVKSPWLSELSRKWLPETPSSQLPLPIFPYVFSVKNSWKVALGSSFKRRGCCVCMSTCGLSLKHFFFPDLKEQKSSNTVTSYATTLTLKSIPNPENKCHLFHRKWARKKDFNSWQKQKFL